MVSNKQVEATKVRARFKGGGSIVDLPPVFSEDSQYIYILCKNIITSYSTKTAKQVSEFRDAKHPIVGFGCTNSDGLEYISACTSNGKVIIWKASNSLKLRELKLRLKRNSKPIYFKVFVQKIAVDSASRALLCFCNEDVNMYEYGILNLDSGQLDYQQIKLTINESLKISMDVSPEQKYFAVTYGNNLYYNPFNQKHLRHSIKDRSFTCVACHPENISILTGDNTGRILLWHNVARKKGATQAIYHWHTLPIDTICFSTSGTYFYSGAAECVLVKWDQNDSNFKNYLPRLPAPIKNIAVSENNVIIAVATADNAVQIISPQLNVVNIIQYLVLGTDSSAGIVYDPRSRFLIMNGVIGHVQLFSPKDMKLVYSLDVVGQNKFTNERDKRIANTLVTKVAVNSSGTWMATVEHRSDAEMFECRLKFWFYDVTKQSFSLNTSIEYPHEGLIEKSVFQPSGNDFELLNVTIAKDKKFKIWRLVEVSSVYFQGHSWQCCGEITYKSFNPTTITFSHDGSLIVVGFESVITAWLANNHKMKCSLRHPVQDDTITHLSFGNGPECHLLFCATSKYIGVWNLLSLSLLWSVRIDVSLVISDPFTPFKVLIATDKKLFIVGLKSPTPIYANKNVLKHVKDVQAGVIIPRTYINSDENFVWHMAASIYLLDSNYGLYSIERKAESTEIDLHIDSTNSSLFSHLIPKISTNFNVKTNTTHMYENGNSADQFKRLLETPVNALPPLHLICEGILNSMVLQRPETKQVITSDEHTWDEEGKDKIGEGSNEKNYMRNCNDNDLPELNIEDTMWVSILFEE